MTAGTEHDRELDSDLVSIIMPTYNCGAFIAETIATVQAQTHPRWELIVVDDCSTDDTTDVVGALAKDDPRIRYVRLETNSGAAMARNRAMELAQGRYMAFLDSDDLWHPDKLRRQIDFMTSRDVAMSCTAYAQIDEQGVPTGRIVRSPTRISYNRLLLDCPVGDSTVIDGALTGAGRACQGVGKLVGATQNGFVRAYASYILAGAVAAVALVLAFRL